MKTYNSLELLEEAVADANKQYIELNYGDVSMNFGQAVDVTDTQVTFTSKLYIDPTVWVSTVGKLGQSESDFETTEES